MATNISAHDQKTSVLLKSVSTEIAGEKIKVGDFIRRFDHHSYGGVLFILAVLCLLPGISILAGFVLILPGFQMLMGVETPRLPAYFDKRHVNVQRLHFACNKIVPFIERIEKVVKPRMHLMNSLVMRKMTGLLIVLLAIVVAIPFPLSNYPPAFAMLLLSLGLLVRDGLFILLGFLSGLIALIFGFTVFNIVFASAIQFLLN
jgi:hypothetical protein